MAHHERSLQRQRHSLDDGPSAELGVGGCHRGELTELASYPIEVLIGGVPTALMLNAKKPTTVNYIMAVAAVPKGFDRVKDIRAVAGGAPSGGAVELVAESGKRVRCALDVGFLAGA